MRWQRRRIGQPFDLAILALDPDVVRGPEEIGTPGRSANGSLPR